jgi:hypothetical protein
VLTHSLSPPQGTPPAFLAVQAVPAQ